MALHHVIELNELCKIMYMREHMQRVANCHALLDKAGADCSMYVSS